MNTSDRDVMIRLALTPPAEVHAPADLGDSIYREIVRTPQRRGLVRLGRLGWLPAPSPLLVTLALLALLAVGLVIVALSRPTSPPIVAMYHGGPDRTGVMPGPGPAGEPVIQWDIGRPGALPFNSMPVPVDGLLVVGDDSGVLAALDQDAGTVLWESDVGSPIHGVAGDERRVGLRRDTVRRGVRRPRRGRRPGMAAGPRERTGARIAPCRR